MATIWADRTGLWVEGSAAPGWSRSLVFRDLDELAKKLAEVKEPITKLALVAHGNQGGLVQLNRDLTAGSVPSFKDQFSRINEFLAQYARVIFYSCVQTQDALHPTFLTGRHIQEHSPF